MRSQDSCKDKVPMVVRSRGVSGDTGRDVTWGGSYLWFVSLQGASRRHPGKTLNSELNLFAKSRVIRKKVFENREALSSGKLGPVRNYFAHDQ